MNNPHRQNLVTGGKVYAVDIDALESARRHSLHQTTVGTTTITSFGHAAPTATATVTNADDADASWLNHSTSTTSGNASGLLSSAYTYVRRDWEAEYVALVKTDATLITSIRYWVGMFSGSVDASSMPAVHLAAFRYDTGTDGTAYWRACASNASTNTVVTTSVAVVANTVYLMRIVCSNVTNDIRYYINGVLVATISTNLPTSSQLMGYGMRVTTLSAAARNLKWSRCHILHN